MQKNNPKIWFGQLYGMSDNIFNLAEEGYNVIKYLLLDLKGGNPLFNSKGENTSVKGQTSNYNLLRGNLKEDLINHL